LTTSTICVAPAATSLSGGAQLQEFGDELVKPSKLAPAESARGEDAVEPLVFFARAFDTAAGPGRIGRAGCAVPRVWLGRIERNGGDLS
jgi:hypothetical protein